MATIKGKWAWNDYIEDKDENGDFQTHCEFVSNGQVFTDLGFGYSSRWDYYSLDYWGEDTGSMQVAASAQGDTTLRLELQEYRFMDFGEAGCEISMDAYDFIVANAEPFYDIADKLRRVYNNVDTVYYSGKSAGREAGKREGYTEGYSNGKFEGYVVGKAEGYQDGLVSSEGYENGYSKAESDFWDAVQNYGNRKDYSMAFRNWRCEYLHPKHKVVPTTANSATNTFYDNDSLKKVEAKYFDFSKKARGGYQGSGWYHTFTTCGELEEIEDIGIMPDADMTNTFQYCGKLKKVAKITVDVNTVISTTIFGSCPALESVTFEGEIGYGMVLSSSTKLTKASIKSIIEHLSDNVSGKTLTLSRTAVDNAFAWTAPDPDGGNFEYGGLEEGSGNEWYPLVVSKSNWQITLE